MKTKLHEAVETLCAELQADPAYYYSWQANIAVAIQDTFKGHICDKIDIHTLSNEAAKQFLSVLLSNKDESE